ncbi:DUF423 domain-containing protein [Rhodopseudomonas palustris]|uniref:DUF423 domain-containing protein n=1 Tax=Rhodopseudomonas palustris TaxID=1076 RepID=UPI002ACEFFE0|nr:DUF423 domain-containing protein [Rhodopseudomonas palustris]WQG99031.1 DUF423 domain-containing protein [Rhodopseudomonas palustris]
MPVLLRLLIVFAGLYGAAGVALAAAAAHVPDAARLGPASSMLLFHASAIAAAVLLAERGLVHRVPGLAASFGFVLGTALFAGDLSLRQFAGQSLFSMAAPTGGMLLIGSWLLLAVAALLARR